MKTNNYSIEKDKNIEDALECIELNGLGLIFIEDRKKIGKGILETCEEFYVSLDALGKNAYSELCKKRSAAHFAINRESPDPESDPSYKEYLELDKALEDFKKNNGWDKFASKE